MVDLLVDLESSCGGDDRCWGILVKFQNERSIETGLPLTDRLPLTSMAALRWRQLTVALMSGSKASNESSMVR
jgi:hypothetical protein